MIKISSIIIYLFILSIILAIDLVDNPDEYWLKYVRRDISSEISLHFNQNKILLQNQKNDLCSIDIIESVKSYIYSEKGNEIKVKTKIKNIGKGEKCILKIVKENVSIFISDIEIKKGRNNIKNFSNTSNYNEIEISFNLGKSQEAIISYKLFNNFPPSLFYRCENVEIEKKTKYTFRAKQPFEIIGSINGEFSEKKQKNGAIYLYYNDIYYNFSDSILISVYGIKFKSELEISLKYTLWNYLNYLIVPNMYEFGNNEIISSEIKSNLYPNEYSIQKGSKFITIKSDKYYRNFIFNFEKIFEAKVDNEWKMDDSNFTNTCTEKTRQKTKEILSNDKSKEKNYIILGRWVNKNIIYNKKYIGIEMSVDEILDKKAGVCVHKTRLYNSFLNCIGINTKETTGYATTSNDNPYNKNYHAWTVAKINGKWISLDSTWNIFFGKLHIGHIFLYYDENIRRVEADGKILPFIMENNNLEKGSIASLLDSNPNINNKLSIIEILSREGDDDNKGDFDIKETSFVLIIIIIIIVVVSIIGIFIFKYLKKKKNETQKSLMDNEESLN